MTLASCYLKVEINKDEYFKKRGLIDYDTRTLSVLNFQLS